MNTMVRTTINIPVELLERLKTVAFYQKRTVSDLVREGISLVVGYRKTQEGSGIKKLIGKYSLKGKICEFSRKDFYEKFIQKEMSS